MTMKLYNDKAKTYYLLICVAFILTGCATSMDVQPVINQVTCHDFKLDGTIQYAKNIIYLPRTVRKSSTIPNKHSLNIKYDYQVMYGRNYLFNSNEIIPLFNPLTLLGAPIGEDNIYITGELNILSENKIIKSYRSVCQMEKTRNLFHTGETFSVMRKKGLLSVRDNIEKQMCKDEAFLIRLSEKSNQF